MNKRSTSWFLAALLALYAAQAVPSARVELAATNSQIVWVARARLEQRVAIAKPAPYSRAKITAALPDDPQASSALCSKSLYQRPPPSFLL